ncbi:hypothetical protein PG913_08375 [Tenacibaculum pacificus]|uniref:hypothetical protein n=1 Tax=Tenacibaculum TaxID=104267 RepID=UPI0022F3DE42|nr:hypothetical protein [Tenacibaculum pacificus]WBX72918.1 hypothetical protein PG913_08375 [Tenacibaculum pacificus]
MSYIFKSLLATEFSVEDHRIYKDGNGQWIAQPPIEDVRLQKAVNNHINSLEYSLIKKV